MVPTTATTARELRWLSADERGGAAVYAAIAMPLLLGSVGLGIDVGLAYSSRQATQHQADAGAMAAALEIANGKTTDEVEAAAQDDAEGNGWLESRGDTIAVTSPPTAGTFAGDATAAEVQITRPVQLSFVRFVGADSDITVSARAVARLVRPEACVWSLEPIEIGSQSPARPTSSSTAASTPARPAARQSIRTAPPALPRLRS